MFRDFNITLSGIMLLRVDMKISIVHGGRYCKNGSS